MFAGLLANVLCGGVADEASVEAVLPRLQAIFERLGYMEASSSDLFDQFLKTGMGAKPIIAAYENQLLEFAAEHPEDWQQLRDDIVLIYPTPTVWSSHIYIALDEAGKRASMPCWTRRSSAWPGSGTASAPPSPERRTARSASASPTWHRRSPRPPPCPAMTPWRRSSPPCPEGRRRPS